MVVVGGGLRCNEDVQVDDFSDDCYRKCYCNFTAKSSRDLFTAQCENTTSCLDLIRTFRGSCRHRGEMFSPSSRW